MKVVLFVVLSFVLSHVSIASWKIQLSKKGFATKIYSVHPSTQGSSDNGEPLQSIPFLLDEGPGSSEELYEEYIFDDHSLPEQYFSFVTQPLTIDHWEGSEVRSIVTQGPDKNRICLTIVGDGYTLDEKGKFFEDAVRITDDLFKGKTFASYLSLFNVYAVFVPSKETGIGDGTPKNTALGLYRNPKGSKRGIFPGNTIAAEKAIALVTKTDFPILLGNDDYYGGLGGRYAITTRSIQSGSVVLRHELGHNFGSVGEEYDGGYVYRGANHSYLSDVPWKYWNDDGEIKVNESIFLNNGYVWTNLSNNPIRIDFNYPSNIIGGHLNILLSTVGWSTPEDVYVTLDGDKLQLSNPFTPDRNFYDFDDFKHIEPGKHTLHIEENIHDNDNVLAFAEIYAMDKDYDLTPNKIGAYASFDSSSEKAGYRPTHNSCLMRDMSKVNFCAVDQENMWVRFLKRVSIIDDVVVVSTATTKIATLATPELNGLSITWYKVEGNQETHLPKFNNLRIFITDQNTTGKFRVKASFRTPEVRTYTKSFDAVKEFTL